jgi:D-alanyl-D-alanine carboxypeptidase/D-alanyl-D-alanine-endopeptidase (penicillin-binding protein 4)
MRDGSGLAVGNRMTCTTLLRVLDLTDEPRYAAVDRGLSVAGRTGTMALRFLGDPLEGRLRAKTGSLNGVVGLAGTIDGGAEPEFAFLATDDISFEGGMDLQAQVAHAVATFPDAQVTKDLVPAP